MANHIDYFKIESEPDSREFLKYAVSFLNDIQFIQISSVIKREVHDIAVLQLGVKDLNKLRDRYEGQAYLDKLMIKVCSLFLIEKKTNTNLIAFEEIKNKNSDFTLITYKGKRYRIIPFIFGSLPIFRMDISNDIILCAVRNDFKSGIVCGIIESKKLSKKSFLKVEGTSHNNFGKFFDFKLVEPIP